MKTTTSTPSNFTIAFEAARAAALEARAAARASSAECRAFDVAVRDMARALAEVRAYSAALEAYDDNFDARDDFDPAVTVAMIARAKAAREALAKANAKNSTN